MEFSDKLLLVLGSAFLTVLALGSVTGTTKHLAGSLDEGSGQCTCLFFFAPFDTPLFCLRVWLLKPQAHEDPDEQSWGPRSFAQEAL